MHYHVSSDFFMLDILFSRLFTSYFIYASKLLTDLFVLHNNYILIVTFYYTMMHISFCERIIFTRKEVGQNKRSINRMLSPTFSA